MQTKLLDAHPDADVQVYAVSFHMLPTDHLARRLVWPEDLMEDPRVIHYWDEKRLAGRFYEDEVTKLGTSEDQRVEWDAYFLYDRDAVWGESPPEHVSWGRTIVERRERLRRDFEDLLTGS